MQFLSRAQLAARGISPDEHPGDRDGGGNLYKRGRRSSPRAREGSRLSTPRVGPDGHGDVEAVGELEDITGGGSEPAVAGSENGDAGAEAVSSQPERIKGSVQIANGLFVGDRQSSIDGQHIRNNQICRIVNTLSSQMKNIFDPAEMSNSKIKEYIQKKPLSFQRLVGQVQYLDFDWRERLTVPKIFEEIEAHRQTRQKLFNFIETAIANHRSVLILSDTNQFRSVIVAAFYIIKKYRWSTSRALEFILSKKEDVQITEEMLKALQGVEADIANQLQQDQAIARSTREIDGEATAPRKQEKAQAFLQEWTSSELLQNNGPMSESGDCRLEEVSMINSFMNSIFLHGSQTQAQIDKDVLETASKKDQEQEEAKKPASMQQIIQQSRYEQARNSLLARRSVKWNDSEEHELFGGVNPEEDDENGTSSSPQKYEKMGTIQQKKRQYEQLKLDQRQMRMFQATHFAWQKPSVHVEEHDSEKLPKDDDEGNKNGRNLTIVNEQTTEQNDTRSQISGSRQPEQEGDFISKDGPDSELMDEDGRLDSEDQAWALKEKKIKNKQSQRFCKAVQEEQLILSKAKPSKSTGPQPILTLAQVQQQATPIPPTSKGTRQSFAAREKKSEGQGRNAAQNNFTTREKTQMKQAARDVDDQQSKLSVSKNSADAKILKAGKQNPSAASNSSNPAKIVEDQSKVALGKVIEVKPQRQAASPELMLRRPSAPPVHDLVDRSPSQQVQGRRQPQQSKMTLSAPHSANAGSRANKRRQANVSQGSQRTADAARASEAGKDEKEERGSETKKKRNQTNKQNANKAVVNEEQRSASNASNLQQASAVSEAKPGSRQAEKPPVLQKEQDKKITATSHQGSDLGEREKEKPETAVLPPISTSADQKAQNQAIAEQIDGKVKNIMRGSQVARSKLSSSGSSLPTINPQGWQASEGNLQTSSSVRTSDRDVLIQNLVRPRNDAFEISSSAQSQQSFVMSHSNKFGNRKFVQKKFQPFGIQTQSLDHAAIPSKDSRFKLAASASKLHKGSLDTNVPLQCREKSFNQAIKQASSDILSTSRVVSTHDSSQGAEATKPGAPQEKQGSSSAQQSRFQQSIEAHSQLYRRKASIGRPQTTQAHSDQQQTEAHAPEAKHLAQLNQIQQRPTKHNPVKLMPPLDNKAESAGHKQTEPEESLKRRPPLADPPLKLPPSPDDETREWAERAHGNHTQPCEGIVDGDQEQEAKATDSDQIHCPPIVDGEIALSQRVEGAGQKAASFDFFSDLRKEKYLKNIKSYQQLGGPRHVATGSGDFDHSSDNNAHALPLGKSGRSPGLKQRAPNKPTLLALPALNFETISQSQSRLKSGRKRRKKSSAQHRKAKSILESTRTDRVPALRYKRQPSKNKLRTSSASVKHLKKQQNQGSQDEEAPLGVLEAHAMKATAPAKRQTIEIVVKKPNKDLCVVPELRDRIRSRPNLLERAGSEFKQAQMVLRKQFDSKDPYGLRSNSSLAPIKGPDVSFVGRQRANNGSQGQQIKFFERRRASLTKRSSFSERSLSRRSSAAQARGSSAKGRPGSLYDPKRTQRTREYIQHFRTQKGGAAASTHV